MKISTKGRYAVRLMIDLAQHDNGEFISLKDVSQRQDITVKYLEQIVSSLSKAGLIRSQRGNNGGYRLTRLPSEYRIGDILPDRFQDNGRALAAGPADPFFVGGLVAFLIGFVVFLHLER